MHGHKPRLYTKWFGDGGASNQIKDYPDAIYKGFYTKEDALLWLTEFGEEILLKYAPNLLDLVDFSIPLQVVDYDIELLKKTKLLCTRTAVL